MDMFVDQAIVDYRFPITSSGGQARDVAKKRPTGFRFYFDNSQNVYTVIVLDPGKGVCADSVGRDATLGVGGPGPPVGAVSVS
jgi:hypothetical protein